jgi:hypothetical protein
MRSWLAICGVAVALGVISASPAQAATTYYTVPGGGSTPCSQTSPCSLPHAISLVVSGDTIVMEPGSSAYTPGSINVPAGITLGGQSGVAAPTIQGPPSGGAVVLGAGVTLHDVHIQGASGQIALFANTGSTIERVASMGTGSGGTACQLGDGTLRDTVCAATSSAGIVQNLGNGTRTLNLTNVTAFGTDGILVNSSGAGTSYVLNGTNVIARGGSSFVDIYAGASSGATSTVALSFSNYATVNSSNPPATSITPPGANDSKTAAPLLDANFRELPGSPTIDAGNTTPDIGNVDLDGNPRESPVCLGGRTGPPDVGAYEFPTISPPVAECSAFTIGKLALNKKKGTANLAVRVPGSGSLAASGKGLKGTSVNATAAGDVSLKLKATGKQRGKLSNTGRLKLKVKLAWTPTGGSPATQTDKVKLKKKS